MTIRNLVSKDGWVGGAGGIGLIGIDKGAFDGNQFYWRIVFQVDRDLWGAFNDKI